VGGLADGDHAGPGRRELGSVSAAAGRAVLANQRAERWLDRRSVALGRRRAPCPCPGGSPSAARGTGRACLAQALALRRISRLRLSTRGNLVPGCGPTLGQDSRVFPAGDPVALVSRWGAGEFHGDVGNAQAGRVDNVGRPG
jgi:hypothetical protein